MVMGAVENITGRIKKDASKKAQKRLDEAKAEAEKLLSQAKSELEREKSEIQQETEKTIKIQRSRALSEGKLEARKLKLLAKEDVIQRAFDLAFERLKNLEASQKEKFINSAFNSAQSELGNDLDVLCHPQDQQLVTKIASSISPRITVSSAAFTHVGGVILRAKDGSAQIDATIEGVLDRMRNDLRREVAEILFKVNQVDKGEE